MEKANYSYTAKELQSLVAKAESEKLQELLGRMDVGQAVVHNLRCSDLKSELLDKAYNKAIEGETSIFINLSMFFESDAGANIPLIIIQLKHELSQMGYTVSSDNHFSHVTLKSYDILTIKW